MKVAWILSNSRMMCGKGDGGGAPLPGFSLAENPGLADQDALDHTVRWNSDRPLPKKPVRLPFHLTDAKLHAFRVNSQP